MELQVGKWGNSLALRLPVALAKRAGLREGSRVEADITAESELRLVKAGSEFSSTSRADLAAELSRMHHEWPVGSSVVRWMRDQGY